MKPDRVFSTDNRLKLGIWGLGRGQSFIASAKALNIDVVAGCDFHKNVCASFQKNCPDAFVTADEDESLAQDLDAVLVATYCPDHAAHAIKAMKAGHGGGDFWELYYFVRQILTGEKPPGAFMLPAM